MIQACNKQRDIHIDLVKNQEVAMETFFDDLLPEINEVFEKRNQADPMIFLRQQRFLANFHRVIAKKFKNKLHDPEMYAFVHKTEERAQNFHEYFVKD